MEQTSTPLLDWDGACDSAPSCQDEYRSALEKQWAIDLAIVKARGLPPWSNDEYELQADEARLLAAIADNCGVKWADNSEAICAETTSMLGMSAIGNAKVTIKNCHKQGFIQFQRDESNSFWWINLTHSGRDTLDAFEDNLDT